MHYNLKMCSYNQKICPLNPKMSKYAKIYTKNFEIWLQTLWNVLCTYSTYEKVNQIKYADAWKSLPY